ncbi:FAD-dependent monooxygenase [Caminibacter mediatlanticus]|uniref:Geranylgeranyl reductase n=1 Tax=Caminibacter mediatlanticus TB-2 TaxID=391592 RepID=A0AAI9AH09_9BACT|nr:FAD-dependent monooxygenase [Caminibacter mediatlanticus]EDM23455.1 Geranylgeranyl reductase [Caminibacter mediatlanticus TB-2]
MKKVLVIGGGVAGATSARLLAKHFDVTLIQDKTWDKPCGGGVKRKIFKMHNLDKSLIKHLLDSIEMVYKNETISLDLKGKNLAIVKREEFDNYLRELAKKNGTNLIYGKFRGFEKNKALVKINNEKVLFDFDILIAADGVNSLVRKCLNLPPIPKVITHYAKTDKIKTNTCKFYFGEEIAGKYYAWAFPHETQTHIGSVEAKNFENLCKYLNIKEKPKGYFIPTWQEDIIIQKENIYFVGDAAGQVMPLSFEGIYYAIKSAEILAHSIINNLDYKNEWNRRYLKKFKFMKMLEKINQSKLRKIMVNLHKYKLIQNFSVNLWLGE